MVSSEMNADDEKIIVYMSAEEVAELDQMQGGPSIDPETGLRDYTIPGPTGNSLEDILENPEVQDLVAEAFSAHKQKMFAEGGPVEEPGRPIAPELETLREQGRGQDTELVILSKNLFNLFEEWMGRKADINPENGIPEFGFFTELLRIAAPVVGAVFGGPLGAAGASVAVNKLTGKDWGNSLKQGAISGLGALAGPVIGGAFQSVAPGLSSAIGKGVSSIAGPSVGGALSNLVTPGAGNLGGALGMGAASTAPLTWGQTKAPNSLTVPPVGQTPPPGQPEDKGFLSNLLSSPNLLPVAGAVGTGLLLSKGHKEDKANHQRLEAKEEEEKQEGRRIRDNLGWDDPLEDDDMGKIKIKNITKKNSKKDRRAGKEKQHFTFKPPKGYYSQGGAIEGIGKGQEDRIPRNIRNGSYILDASTVSDMGDGSTKAGFQELNMYFPSHSSKNSRSKSKGGTIEAMVSDGEFEIEPDHVTRLGGGSNEKGARILDRLVKQIRAQKRTSGKGLPPKSRPLNGYLNKIKAA